MIVLVLKFLGTNQKRLRKICLLYEFLPDFVQAAPFLFFGVVESKMRLNTIERRLLVLVKTRSGGIILFFSSPPLGFSR